MPIPRVLVCHHVRPMTAGLMFDFGFKQAGCDVRVAGPGTCEVYGFTAWDDGDYVPPDVELPDAPIEQGIVLETVKERLGGWTPDLIVMIDQYDPFRLCGPKAGVPLAYVCVENWGAEYASRFAAVETDHWYYMIRHLHGCPDIPLPDGAEWLPFGFDPQQHRYMPGVTRDKTVIQIGSPYEPRPSIWNALRGALDGEPALADAEYRTQLQETAKTIFGKTPSHWQNAIAHNRAKVALSSSNCDFAPMRVCEAYGMGCLLVSDRVPAVEAVLGPPFEEGGFWFTHDRTAQGTIEAVMTAAANYDQVIDRGIAHVYKHHQYRNRCERILAKAGMRGACRVL